MSGKELEQNYNKDQNPAEKLLHTAPPGHQSDNFSCLPITCWALFKNITIEQLYRSGQQPQKH